MEQRRGYGVSYVRFIYVCMFFSSSLSRSRFLNDIHTNMGMIMSRINKCFKEEGARLESQLLF